MCVRVREAFGFTAKAWYADRVVDVYWCPEYLCACGT